MTRPSGAGDDPQDYVYVDDVVPGRPQMAAARPRRRRRSAWRDARPGELRVPSTLGVLIAELDAHPLAVRLCLVPMPAQLSAACSDARLLPKPWRAVGEVHMAEERYVLHATCA